jgi:DNA-binding response OmpR family regulator
MRVQLNDELRRSIVHQRRSVDVSILRLRRLNPSKPRSVQPASKRGYVFMPHG